MTEKPAIRRQLIDGAIETIRRHGFSGTSVPSIAHAAGVHETVVCDHFASLHDLLAEASHVAAQDRVGTFRNRFDGVSSLRELLVLGRQLWAEERDHGNVVLSQLLAGARHDPALAAATEAAMQLWVSEIERLIRGLLRDSPLAGLIEPAAAARVVCAGFVGLSLFGAAEQQASPFDILEPLAELAEDLKPLERRILVARVRSHVDRRR